MIHKAFSNKLKSCKKKRGNDQKPFPLWTCRRPRPLLLEGPLSSQTFKCKMESETSAKMKFSSSRENLIARNDKQPVKKKRKESKRSSFTELPKGLEWSSCWVFFSLWASLLRQTIKMTRRWYSASFWFVCQAFIQMVHVRFFFFLHIASVQVGWG